MATTKPYSEQETTPATQPDKVAEALSPYIAHTEMRRGVLTKKVEPPRIAGLPVSEEVWRFAQENALVPHLETAVRLARESFKEIRNIRLEYGIDYEIPHWNSINIHLDVAGTMEELLRADEKYRRAFTTTIPDEHQFKICLLLWPEIKGGNATEVIK